MSVIQLLVSGLALDFHGLLPASCEWLRLSAPVFSPTGMDLAELFTHHPVPAPCLPLTILACLGLRCPVQGSASMVVLWSGLCCSVQATLAVWGTSVLTTHWASCSCLLGPGSALVVSLPFWVFRVLGKVIIAGFMGACALGLFRLGLPWCFSQSLAGFRPCRLVGSSLVPWGGAITCLALRSLTVGRAWLSSWYDRPLWLVQVSPSRWFISVAFGGELWTSTRTVC